MSDSQAYEEVTAASDGVVVTKRFEADEFPVPAIAFNVTSQRSEAVTVRLVDTVPEDVAVEDLGFHPEYGSEYWDIDEDQITFEREVEPESEYTTVYGIRATGTDDVEKFLTEPVLEDVNPPLDEDEADIVGSSDNAVKDVISGNSDSVPGLEDDGDDEDIETLNLKDPNGEGEPAESQSGSDGGDNPTPEVAIENGNVVAAMAAEIRQNNVSADDVKMLKRALDVVSENDTPTDGTKDARVKQLQQDIADLRAYTGALEEFLDENGTGDEMIEAFSDRLEEFETELQTFESKIETARSEAEAAGEEVETLDMEVETIGQNVEEMSDNLDSVDSTLEELEGEMDAVENELDELREEIGDGEIDERLSSLESEIEGLNEWREQLSSVIGGGAGGE